jgi:predicted MPP superfamily phosphohydrolase
LLFLKFLGVTVRNELTWLHISDIHFHPNTEWRDSVARSGLLTYLSQAFDRNDLLRPDFIFCTGDIAYGETGSSPLGDQYAQAKTFLDELLVVCGRGGVPLSKRRLFVVPGNHDVNRKSINSHAQATLTQWAKAASEHALTINQEINDRSKEFKDAVRRLDEYAQFVREYLPHQQDAEGRHRYANIVDVDDLKVGIAGFNSAWSCAGPEDDRTVWLAAEWQFNAAREEIGEADVRIGLIHHPVDWLNEADRDIATRRISTDFHFWLHGHSHNAWVVPTQSHVVIAAGAVGAQTSEEFGTNLVRVNLSESNGTVGLHEHRAGGTSWKAATVETHAPDGHWPFRLPANLCKSVTPLPLVSSRAVGDEEYFEQDMAPSRACSESQFLALVDNYSDNLPTDLRRITIGEIATHAWEIIVFAPYFANGLITHLTTIQNGIAPIVIPLCKVSTDRSINPDELTNFFSALDKEIASVGATPRWPYILLAQKMIRGGFNSEVQRRYGAILAAS